MTHKLFTVAADWAGDCPVQIFLATLEKHKGVLVSWTTEGPGGGNPEIVVGFDDREHALEYATEHYADSGLDDDKAWLSEQVTDASNQGVTT